MISKEQLAEERERLSGIMYKLEDRLKDVPEGKLQLGKSNGVVQYFYFKDGKAVYLPKKEIKLVKQLVQKNYDQRVLKCVKKRISQINRVLSDYENNEIDNLYLSEHPERRKLIDPVEPTYEQKLELWMSEPYEGKSFRSDAPVIRTNSGLRVRSKTEKIMADYFDLRGVKYKYECPLELKTYGVVYPDFTFISPRTGKEIYWEHEGMMDNPEYARTAVMKIESYEKNGIVPGENLILTFETSNSVIDMEIVKQFTEKYLI